MQSNILLQQRRGHTGATDVEPALQAAQQRSQGCLGHLLCPPISSLEAAAENRGNGGRQSWLPCVCELANGE